MSNKTNREILLKAIESNELKIDTLVKDLSMFEDLFHLNSNQEKAGTADTYIFRQVKLMKELNKIKKKIHSELGLEELRQKLPFEQFLKRALEDDNDESEADEIEYEDEPKIVEVED